MSSPSPRKKPSSKLNLSLLDNNRLLRARSSTTNPPNRYFCQVGSIFGNSKHKPQCKCNQSHPCPHSLSWLHSTPISHSHLNIQTQYRLLPQTHYPQIDYAYEIIDLQIYKKFSVLLASMQEKEVLRRILVKYASSNYRAKRKPYIEACGWLAAHIMYHCTEATAYYVLEGIVEHLELLEEERVRMYEERTLKKICETLQDAVAILHQYNINPMEIIRFFSNDMFAKSIPVELMGWNIQKYFEEGWDYFARLVCSYVDYKLETNQAETRNELYKSFFSTGNVEWPIVFANIGLYKDQPSKISTQL